MEEAKDLQGGNGIREETFLERLKPYLYSIFIAISFGGFNIVSKISLDKGMRRCTLVAYGFIFERVATRILLYAGLEFTSPTFVAAMNNLNPTMTFLLAILCRMEKLDFKNLSGQAKIAGTDLSLGGATLMTIYKGITVLSFHSQDHIHQKVAKTKVFLDSKTIKGSIMLLVQSLSISVFFILQTTTVEKYPAPLILTTLINLSGTLVVIIAAAILEHRASPWKLSWDITLLAPLYGGIVFFGITTYVQALVVRKRGPVFMTAFRPLSTVVVGIMSLFILGEALHLGGIIGAAVIVIGLYSILWGKDHEKRNKLLELKPVI